MGARPRSGDDGERYLAALEEIGAIGDGYLLMVVIEEKIELTPAQKKAQNLWYKATRDRINAACRACAIVRPDADAGTQDAFGKLYTFPLLVTRNRGEAETFLAAHDGREPAR
ncbi:hypothetical protein ACUSIJ_15880 [Pseudochelatococcus sp. B33]